MPENVEIKTTKDKDLREVTQKSKGLLSSRYGLWVLAIISFVESMLLIPLITDPFLIAYILLHRSKVVTAVVVTLAASIIGGLVAYITANFFIDIILGFLSDKSVAEFYVISEEFKNSTFILGLVGAITPVPFTLTALAAGAIKGNLLLFLSGVFVGRSVRYSIAGYLTYHYGEDAVRMARKNIKPITIITFVSIIIYFLLTM
ncbi:MAG: VTT domain-containing protein [Candidatus Nomurabacteria bacterium]|nr:VTT domain-containing protein [Candidatus Nomurabacteria bacterium]USN88280.1 MAG: VTT domain-containing protein [Candidatus Nomurabacteria bacterium]